MVNNLGYIIQLINIWLSIVIFFIEGNKLRKLFIINSILLICCFIWLAYKFSISDFSIKTIFFHSSTIKPFIYKLCASWASPEGSITLWLAILSIISIGYVLLFRSLVVMNIQIKLLNFIQLLFILFIYFVSNPFDSLSFRPKEGIGLNPMLQDIALSFHPPILYLGLVCYVIHFVIIITLLKEYKNNNIIFKEKLSKSINILIIFSRLALTGLTIGILSGSWWAYRELGFGGFWFFDPVENISLLPYFIGIALHHTLIIWQKTNNIIVDLDSGSFIEFQRRIFGVTHSNIISTHHSFINTNSSFTNYTTNWLVFLSVLNFLLVIFGMLLVRSGLLMSVHAFAFAKEKAQWLLMILLVLAIPSIFLVFRYIFFSNRLLIMDNSSINKTTHIGYTTIKKLSEFKSNDYKQTGINLANGLWLLLIIFLLFTLLYPLVYQYYTSIEISISEEFFINNFLPLFIPLIILCGVCTEKNASSKNIIIILLLIILTLIILKLNNNLYLTLFIISPVYLIIQILTKLVNKTQFFNKPISNRGVSLLLGHFGFALLVMSIAFNTWFKSKGEFIGKIGDSIKFDRFNVTLRDIKYAKTDNYYKQIAAFEIQDNYGNITLLKPENRFYNIEKAISMESDIFSYLFYDLYAVLHKVDEDIIFAYIYYQPFISFIWLAMLIISFSFII